MPAKPAPSVCPQNSQENVDCNKVPPCPPSHQPKEKVQVGGREREKRMRKVEGPTFGQDWVDVEEGMKKEVRKRPKRERTAEEGRV